jgi:hypothetical protein
MKIVMTPAAKNVADRTARTRTAGASVSAGVIWFMLTPAM